MSRFHAELKTSSTMPDRISVSTPWNEAFTAELKAAIPWTMRLWDKGERAWLVAVDFTAECRRLCLKHFGKVALSEEIERLLAKDEEDFPMEPGPGVDADEGWWE